MAGCMAPATTAAMGHGAFRVHPSGVQQGQQVLTFQQLQATGAVDSNTLIAGLALQTANRHPGRLEAQVLLKCACPRTERGRPARSRRGEAG